jgi:hypothetical protein
MSWAPSIAWNGSNYTIVWTETAFMYASLSMARFAGGGSRIGSTTTIVAPMLNNAINPRLVWSGTEFGLAWVDDRDGMSPYAEMYFARLAADGTKTQYDTMMSTDWTSYDRPEMVFTGSEYAVVFTGYNSATGNEIRLFRVSAAGAKVGSDTTITVTADAAKAPSIAWSGSIFGVSWYYDAATDAARFTLVSATGAAISTNMLMESGPASSQNTAVVWTGSEFGVIWDDWNGGITRPLMTLVTPGFVRSGLDLPATLDGTSAYMPELVWNGSEFLTAWQESRDGNSEIYANRISFCE